MKKGVRCLFSSISKLHIGSSIKKGSTSEIYTQTPYTDHSRVPQVDSKFENELSAIPERRHTWKKEINICEHLLLIVKGVL